MGQAWTDRHILTVGAAVGAVVLLLVFLGPIASALARLSPEGTGGALADTVVSEFATVWPECHEPAGHQALNRLSELFALEAEITPPKLTVLRSETANAFALPGSRRDRA